ncbi:MAG: FAD:protein FMN transferase [Minisyncoccota bacterium]
MGMPITVEIQESPDGQELCEEVFAYFRDVDERFSTYQSHSEISRINRGEIVPDEYSKDMRDIFSYAEIVYQKTDGFFDIRTSTGGIDPSGIVKGWAIECAATLLKNRYTKHFFVDAGGDVAVGGGRADGEPWSIGIRNPFAVDENIKILFLREGAVATSGSYIRGNHIYNPHNRKRPILDVVSLTVVGPSMCDADIYATACFAMGKKGIEFIESCAGYEGYQIDKNGIAVMTTGFWMYTKK